MNYLNINKLVRNRYKARHSAKIIGHVRSGGECYSKDWHELTFTMHHDCNETMVVRLDAETVLKMAETIKRERRNS